MSWARQLPWLAPAPALAGGHTARADLPRVLAQGKTWQRDAILVHLSSTTVLPDGTAPEWKYAFYSPATGKRCVVTARKGGVTTKEVRLGNHTEPLGEFVDSDQAMGVARKNGLKGGEPSMALARPTGAGADGTRWLVSGGFKDGDTSISVEARTGAFAGRAIMGKD